MFLSKVLLCELCVVLLFGLILIAQANEDLKSNTAAGELKGNCSCGGFPGSNYTEGSSPVLSQTTGLVVTCDETGATTCMSLCTALATAAKAKGPEVMCARLVDANELKLSAFYKVCDHQWVYGNMTAEEPLCCQNSQFTTCALKPNNNSAV